MAGVFELTCIICLKPISDSYRKICTQSEHKIYDNLEIDLFLKHFNRYICANQKQNGNTRKITRVCCTDCIELVNSFNQLYLELECLRFKLDDKLFTLNTRAEHANRVPSRFHRIRINAVSKVEAELLEEMIIFRKDFQASCTTHLSKTTPKVILKRRQLASNNNTEQVIRTLSQIAKAEQNEIESRNESQIKTERDDYYSTNDSIGFTQTLSPNNHENEIDTKYHFPVISSLPSQDQPDELSFTKLAEENEETFILPDTVEPNKYHENKSQSQQKPPKSKLKKFPCTYCPLTFSEQSKCVRHMWCEHTREKPCNQIIIPETSTTIGDWVNKTGAKFKCSESICNNASFMTEEELQYHLELHGSFPCQFCEEVKIFAPDLAKHELEVHADPKGSTSEVQQCPRCNYQISKRSPFASYLNHYLLKHQNLYMDCCRCPICKRPFLAKNSYGHLEKNLFLHWLASHQKSNSDDNQTCATCHICGFIVKGAAGNMKIHMDTHYKPKTRKKLKTFQCHICNKSFKTRSVLKRHYFTHKTASSAEMGNLKCGFECTICGKKFRDKSYLLQHQESLLCRRVAVKKRLK